MPHYLFFFFFFFQAEDGIRDSSVTGVQTCALPIWSPSVATSRFRSASTNSGIGLLPAEISSPRPKSERGLEAPLLSFDYPADVTASASPARRHSSRPAP